MDFLAVLFDCENRSLETACQLANIFPGAKIIGFQNSESPPSGGPVWRREELLVVHLPMLFSFATHLMEVLASTRRGQEELALARRRADELSDLFQNFVSIIESAWSVGERKQSLSILIRKVAARLRAEECLIYLYNEGDGSLQRAYGTGSVRGMDLFDYHSNTSIIENVVKGGTPYINNDYSFELKLPFNKESALINSILCVPLQRGGERIGAIEVLNKIEPAGFTEEDVNLVQMLVYPLSVALRNIDMFENSERLTITDDLTKLYNYRYLMQYLDAEVKRCLRYKKKVSLLFIDIDGFKRINDRFGHLVGSQALSEMGQVFCKILRETDIVGRYGGDEFVIVLPETPLNGAMVIAERIRQKVESYEFVAQNLPIRLTVSLGVANCPKHTLTAEGLIKKADAAMYRAKELSKNTIRVAV
jgi:diguanylate cyclase (GGDEF)-like protein